MMSRQTPRASGCTSTLRSPASVVLVVSALAAAGCVSKPTLEMFQAASPYQRGDRARGSQSGTVERAGQERGGVAATAWRSGRPGQSRDSGARARDRDVAPALSRRWGGGVEEAGGGCRGPCVEANARQSGRTDDEARAGRAALGKKGVRGRIDAVEEVARLVSAGTARRYPLQVVCAAWRVPRSTVYARRHRVGPSRGKRGPRTAVSDAEVLTEIRAVLAASPFHTEGHRKVRARLRPRGLRVGKTRVLRLMRGARLLAPQRRRHVHGDRTHSGRIITAPGRRGGPRNSDRLLRWDPDQGEGVWHATEETELSG